MRLFKAFFALAGAGRIRPHAQPPASAPQGAEGEPNRAQQWLVPSPDPDRPRTRCCFARRATGRFRWR